MFTGFPRRAEIFYRGFYGLRVGVKRHGIQLETKLRATVETYQHLLNADKDDEKENEPSSKIKVLNR